MWSRSRTWRVFIIGWITCIIVGSFLPAPVKISLHTKSANTEKISSADNLMHRAWHIVTFAITALLLISVGHTRFQKASGALATFGLGLAIETAQAVVYHSVFEITDLRDDSCGILLVTVVLIKQSASRMLKKAEWQVTNGNNLTS